MYLFLQKKNFVLKFNKLSTTGSSSICGIDLHPMTPEYAAPALDQGTKLKASIAHTLLGHCSEDSTRHTAKYYGWDLTGTFPPCDDCGIGKAKQVLAWQALMKEELGVEWLMPDLFRFGASSLLADIERQLYHYITGHYAARHHMPMG